MNTATAARPAKASAKQTGKGTGSSQPAPEGTTEVKTLAEAPPPLQTINEDKPRKVEQLGPARLQTAEFVRNVHVADAAPGTQPQDLEVPSYWAHVGLKLKARDRIEVWTDDNAWIAECVVLAASKTEAVVKVLGAWDLNGHQVAHDRADSALAAYRVEFRGHFERWGVIRKADNALVHSEEATEGAAYAWLKERLKAGV